MGIVVEHGPSMVPVGRLAFRTGQNQYIDRRRREMEALQQQRSDRQMKAQMHINDINAGFQRIQMNHQMGMERAQQMNEFSVDRDQKMHDWSVQAAGDLFTRQKDLADTNHGYRLEEAEHRNTLQDQTMIRNNHTLQMDKTLNSLYSQSNEQGRELIDSWRGQMSKLYGHVGEGKITEQDYQAKYSEGLANIMSQLTGPQSSIYRINSAFLPGGTRILHDGAVRQTMGPDGQLFFEKNYPMNPETGEAMTPAQWEEKYEVVKTDPSDPFQVPYKTSFDMNTGQEIKIPMTNEWKAQKDHEQKTMEMWMEQKQAQSGAASLEVVGSYNNYYEQLYPRPDGIDPAEIKDWEANRDAWLQSHVPAEHRGLLGDGIGGGGVLAPGVPRPPLLGDDAGIPQAAPMPGGGSMPPPARDAGMSGQVGADVGAAGSGIKDAAGQFVAQFLPEKPAPVAPVQAAPMPQAAPERPANVPEGSVWEPNPDDPERIAGMWRSPLGTLYTPSGRQGGTVGDKGGDQPKPIDWNNRPDYHSPPGTTPWSDPPSDAPGQETLWESVPANSRWNPETELWVAPDGSMYNKYGMKHVLGVGEGVWDKMDPNTKGPQIDRSHENKTNFLETMIR